MHRQHRLLLSLSFKIQILPYQSVNRSIFHQLTTHSHYHPIIINLQMLFRTFGSPNNRLSFAQELSLAKDQTNSKPQSSKDLQCYQAMSSVLQLIIKGRKSSTDQLLILKQCLRNWYDEVCQRTMMKNKEMLQLKQKLVVYIKNELGVVLQQVGGYIKNVAQNFRDPYMKEYYWKYLKIVKKLQWKDALSHHHHAHSVGKNHAAVQTQSQQTNHQLAFPSHYTIPSHNSIPPSHRTLQLATKPSLLSCSTIQQFGKSTNDNNLGKYIKAKEQSMSLLRKNDQLTSRNDELEQLNKRLKAQIQGLSIAKQQSLEHHKMYLDQINKLSSILQQLNQQQKHFKQSQQGQNDLKDKLEGLMTKKKLLHEGLEQVEQRLLEEQQSIELQASVYSKQESDSMLEGVQESEQREMRLLLLLQAVSIQKLLSSN